MKINKLFLSVLEVQLLEVQVLEVQMLSPFSAGLKALIKIYILGNLTRISYGSYLSACWIICTIFRPCEFFYIFFLLFKFYFTRFDHKMQIFENYPVFLLFLRDCGANLIDTISTNTFSASLASLTTL